MKLHIISFDVPWPADYGGVIDIYNRLEALNDFGVEVILHAFDYGRGQAIEVEKICSEVYYYKRKNLLLGNLKKDPMIVATRSSSTLLKRLKLDNNPILFEGQHTTFFIDSPTLEDRKKLVRIHNIEHEYYSSLAEACSTGFKKTYFKKESRKLKSHEKNLQHADQLLCITQKDTDYYQEKFGNASYLPVALKCNKPSFKQNDSEPFILYHGNLSVAENINAVKWLINNVCPIVNHNFIFAGKSPDTELNKIIEQHENVKLIKNPSEKEMHHLINSAKVHALYTSQSTGIKIKLLKALCSHAPIVCNDIMVQGTGLEKECIVASNADDFASSLTKFMNNSAKDVKLDRKELMLHFDYQSHVKKILSLLQ